eukprot:gnl/Hemi2/10722_TR3680_c0_g1_i1.p1 gnl/Hemi2/10722_TR3680_c0_g1~~gnl/Hemi2/10722_TR3680_c0_g1_i1.p1  ORF type:complete len:284 (+),score=93.88 gnl/Hemi2/10722_TR3680_c0_g1_i1:60-911(+)
MGCTNSTDTPANSSSLHTRQLHSIAGNGLCADCEAPNPAFASLDLCVLLCADCYLIHQSLGPGFQQVIPGAELTPDNIAGIKTTGNVRSNCQFEKKLQLQTLQSVDAAAAAAADVKPKPQDSLYQKADFVYSKYARQAFTDTGDGLLVTSPCRPQIPAKPPGQTGTLSVKVVSAENLQPVGPPQHIDPAVVLVCGATEQRTEAKQRSVHPAWNAMFSFFVASTTKDVLKLSVVDQHTTRAPDPIGDVDISLEKLRPHETRKTIAALRNVRKGAVVLELTFTPK